MTRTLHYLGTEDLVEIATAPIEETTAQLAARLGRPYYTVHKARQRLVGEGLATKLKWTTCAVCGEPLCHGPHLRRVHPQCKSAHVAHLARESRKRKPGQSTPYVRRWRKTHQERARELATASRDKCRELRHATYTREDWQPLLDKAHQTDRRDQDLTAELAEESGNLWMPDEDQYVWDHLRDPARDVALYLGRTMWAVRNRRVRLRRQRSTP